MDSETQHLVQTIHDHSAKLIMVTAGAGTQALSDLLGVPGASRTLLEALVPYSEAAFDDFLGQTPPKYVDANTAKLMAGRALTRARWLCNKQLPLIGLACTATIITDRPKKGEHRAHIATWQNERLVHTKIRLQKGARDRVGEEDVVSRLMLNTFASACGLAQQLPIPLLPGDSLIVDESNFATAAQKLHQHESDFFAISAHGRLRIKNVSPPLLLSGAFNPLHEGHLALAQTAASLWNQPIAFELAAMNVDKPPLSPEIILDRVAQFAGRWPIYVTNAPTFTEKARLFPGATFVVGYDTAVRILHPRYYNHSRQEMMAALTEVQQQGCRFLVGGRLDDTGTFQDINALHIPADLQGLFIGIPADKFRSDISSTELRATGRKGSR
ncbi:MAG: hypothetical protein KC419_19345 [Anaerolineales bacterium]|nr:hypothetical protein [Anaerolineales bacterium]MCA9930653.1 hypothetical protein [Anaerolineales bacterium]